MKRYICDGIVKGATHVRNQMPCQDNKRIVEISDKIAIIAVADGHGSSKCPRSDRGSMIAVNSFYEVMKNYLKVYGEDETGLSNLITFLNREGDMVYDYFNLTDELMNQDHKADSSLPVCRSKKANYYVQRGYSFQMRHRLMAYIDRLIEKNERIYEFRAEGRLNKVAIEKEVADHIVQKLHEQGRSSVGIKTCSNRELGIYRIEIS